MKAQDISAHYTTVSFRKLFYTDLYVQVVVSFMLGMSVGYVALILCADRFTSKGQNLARVVDNAVARVEAPLLALWGAEGTVGRTDDVPNTWRETADDVSGLALDCGRAPQEERPEEVVAEPRRFVA